MTNAAPEYSKGVKCACRKQRDSAMEIGIAAVIAVFIQFSVPFPLSSHYNLRQ